MQKNNGILLLIIYFALAIYLLPIFPHGGSDQETARWATTVSLVEKNSFDILWTEQLTGKIAGAVKIEDKIYSTQTPGIAVITAPIYALTRVFIGQPSAENIHISWFIIRFCVGTLPLFFLGLWLYQRDIDEFSLGVLFFATPLFIFSILLSSYVLASVLVYFVFRLIYDTPRVFLRNCLAAGLLAGIAVISEYTAIIPVLIFASGLFFTDPQDKYSRIFFFALGFLPFAVLLLIYNHLLFGSPFPMFFGYGILAENAMATNQGFSGFSYPTPEKIYFWLLSPARGLFFYSPILLFSLIAFFTSRERGKLRHRVKLWTIIFSILILCGFEAVDENAVFGAAYLIVIIPLMLDSFFDGEIYDYSNIWQGFLFLISFLFCTIPALTFPFAPSEFTYPHNNFWWKLLLDENWFTPNLANVIGFSGSFWTILPAVILLFGVLFVVWRNARRPNKFFIGAMAGLILSGIYLFLPGLDKAEYELRRAAIIEKLRGNRD